MRIFEKDDLKAHIRRHPDNFSAYQQEALGGDDTLNVTEKSNFIQTTLIAASDEKFNIILSKLFISTLLNRIRDIAQKSFLVKAKRITTIIHRLGKLAQLQRISIDAQLNSKIIDNILIQLVSANSDTQGIANALYGLGLLAANNVLNGVIAADPINALLRQLIDSDPDSQNIANACYGIGLLAANRRLNGSIAANLINNLLEKLIIINPNDQAIANTIYSLGLLAANDVLNGVIAADAVNELLYLLRNTRPIASQAIANTLYGLGLLAANDVLTGKVATYLINDLLELLIGNNPKTQNIGNTLYGVGLLAIGNQLDSDDINIDLVNNLLEQLVKWEPMPQETTNSLYGIGLLAESSRLKGKITANIINDLLQKLILQNLNAQDIANTLYGIGLLAANHNLENTTAIEFINNLLEQLTKVHPDIQNVGNTFYGIGLLAASCELADVTRIDLINNLLKQLTTIGPSESGQHIANTIFGVGLLVVNHKFSGEITADNINDLLRQLTSSNPTIQGVANTLYGAGLLQAKCGVIIDANLVDQCLSKAEELFETALQNSKFEQEHCTQIANALGYFGRTQLPEWLCRKLKTPVSSTYHQEISNLLNKPEFPSHEDEALVCGFFVDMLFREQQIIVELDGLQHHEISREIHDNLKDQVLTQAGYKVLRIKTWWKEPQEVINEISSNFKLKEGLIHPANSTTAKMTRQLTSDDTKTSPSKQSVERKKRHKKRSQHPKKESQQSTKAADSTNTYSLFTHPCKVAAAVATAAIGAAATLFALSSRS